MFSQSNDQDLQYNRLTSPVCVWMAFKYFISFFTTKNSHPEVFWKFCKFSWKTTWWSSWLVMLHHKACNFTKSELSYMFFPRSFAAFFFWGGSSQVVILKQSLEGFLQNNIFKNFIKFTGRLLLRSLSIFPPEVFCKKVFLQISQILQENTRARVSFPIKLQAWGSRFPVKFAKFVRTLLFLEHIWWLLLKHVGMFDIHQQNHIIAVGHFQFNPLMPRSNKKVTTRH